MDIHTKHAEQIKPSGSLNPQSAAKRKSLKGQKSNQQIATQIGRKYFSFLDICFSFQKIYTGAKLCVKFSFVTLFCKLAITQTGL